MNEVKALKLKELLKSAITIPYYHRGYEWREGEVEEMIESVIEGFKRVEPVYMGTLVFYGCDGRCEVVDGVQRLSTLFLILETLGVENDFGGLRIEEETRKRIKKFIDEKISKQAGIAEYMKENIEFSCVYCNSLDECFALFDDLNSRGKKYETYELIKIYHLGKMREKGDGGFVESYAKRFDEIAQRARGARIRKLFYELLSLARMWIRNKSSECIRETSGAKKEEFEREVFEEFCPKIDKRFEMFNSFSIQDMGVLRDFGEGRGFFEYLFYFDSLLDKVEAMTVWRELREGDEELCKYLRFVYEMMMLIYLDKFRDGNLEVAHLWIFRVVYSLVLQKEKITRESARDWGKRLLAILYHSGSEREFISRIAKVIAPQKEKITKAKLYKIAKTQRERYAIPKFGREL